MNNRIATPLIAEIPFSPVETFELFKDEPYSFFLDSGIDKYRLGRYSFIGNDPFLIFKSRGKEIEIITNAKRQSLKGNPFFILKDLFKNYKLSASSILPPFLGGAVGYFAYDLCHFVEKLPSQSIDDLNLPECYLAFYDRVLIFDHLKKRTYISSTGLPEGKTRAKLRLKEMQNKLKQKIKVNPSLYPFKKKVKIESNFTKEGYLKAVAKAKEYIVEGDIYQVNLSQRFSTDLLISPFELYKQLRLINPAPFAGFLNFPEVTVLSSSPERFLRMSGQKVITRPIKGTRPRGKNLVEDKKFSKTLLTSAKDKAELVMIVDLERNDLGRVCKYGSVRVPKLITLETYATVFHLVGMIEGILYKDSGHLDCLRACFPGGSITGAPKIRAMEIIDELEPTKRSIYTGCLGYLGFNGETDLNIVIRTMLIKENKIYFQVGGGIVADSEPEQEYEETLAKAKALREALTLNGRICLS